MFFQDIFQFPHDLMRLLQCIGTIYYNLFMWFIITLLLIVQWREYVYDLDLFYDMSNITNKHNKKKLLLSFDISNPMWYPERSDLIRPSKVLSVSSLTMSSVLSLFECMTGSSLVPLEEKNLIVIVNLIFHVSDFLRSFMISFRYA